MTTYPPPPAPKHPLPPDIRMSDHKVSQPIAAQDKATNAGLTKLFLFLKGQQTGSVTFHVKDGRVMEVETKERVHV